MHSGKDNHRRKKKSRSRPTSYNSVVFSFLSSNHPMYTFSLYFSDHFPFVYFCISASAVFLTMQCCGCTGAALVMSISWASECHWIKPCTQNYKLTFQSVYIELEQTVLNVVVGKRKSQAVSYMVLTMQWDKLSLPFVNVGRYGLSCMYKGALYWLWRGRCGSSVSLYVCVEFEKLHKM